MQAIKTRVRIPKDHHLSFRCQVPVSIPAGLTDVTIIFEWKKTPTTKHRVLGQLKGRVKIADNFDAPLSDSFWLGDDA